MVMYEKNAFAYKKLKDKVELTSSNFRRFLLLFMTHAHISIFHV